MVVVRLTITLPSEIVKKLQEKRKKEGVPISAQIRLLLQKELSK